MSHFITFYVLCGTAVFLKDDLVKNGTDYYILSVVYGKAVLNMSMLWFKALQRVGFY